MINTEIPELKQLLRETYGDFVSFQLALCHVDVIGIYLCKKMEIVIITFRGNLKTGFIYEGGGLTPEQAFRIYQDVPEDINNISEYEERMSGKVSVYRPPKYHYIIEDNNRAKPIKKNTAK